MTAGSAARLPAIGVFYNAFQASLNKRFSQRLQLCWLRTRSPKTWGMRTATSAVSSRTRIAPIWSTVRLPRICGTDYHQLSVRTSSRAWPPFHGRRAAESQRHSWADGRLRESRPRRAARRRTAVLSSDLSNTGSFSYRPNQIANPYDFSFNSGVSRQRLWLHQSRDIRLWIAGTTRRHLSHLRSRPGSNPPTASETPRSEICVDLTWLISILFCKRTSRFGESQQVEFRAEFFNLLNHPNFGLPGGGSSVPVDVPGGAASPTQRLTIARSSSH